MNWLRKNHAIPSVGNCSSCSDPSQGAGSQENGFIVAWPTAPASRLERTLRRNRLGPVGKLLYQRSRCSLEMNALIVLHPRPLVHRFSLRDFKSLGLVAPSPDGLIGAHHRSHF